VLPCTFSPCTYSGDGLRLTYASTGCPQERFFTLTAYIFFFVLAPLGYLFYSRGLSKGFHSASWFLLLVVSLFLGILLIVKFLAFILNSVGFHGP
jgi:lysylphosphatidylglycerol synthetase-like protein (DUF2156 family)